MDQMLGRITLAKLMDETGRIYVVADYEDLTTFEAIGMLIAELDIQRAPFRGVS